MKHEHNVYSELRGSEHITRTRSDAKPAGFDRNNIPLPPIRFSFREWTGAIGDVAVLVPLFLAMAGATDFPLGRSFLLVGLLYIWCGLYYRLPVPVQPLKAIAAVVLAAGLPFEVVRWAAFMVGLVLLMGTHFTTFIERLFPRHTVKAIQLGLGLILVKTGWRLMLGGAAPHRIVPSSTEEAVLSAIILLVVPQIPLTLGNSIFGCADAARTYFGRASLRVSPRSLLADLGIANLFAAAIGAFPLCHGSGGLTAHYAFGARTGGAVIIAGFAYLVLAFLGSAAAPVLKLIPNTLIGASLLYVGIKHAFLIRSLQSKHEWATAVLAALAAGLSGNLAWAFVIGWGSEMLRWAYLKVFSAETPEPG